MKYLFSGILSVLFYGAVLVFLLPTQNFAQSSSIEYPTVITGAEISSTIAARDIGDSRTTIHYYLLQTKQGDLFLTIESQNLNADIDFFYADNLRPVSKISIYADGTGKISRELYFRKDEKLILKIEGKSPTDEPALYKILFAGSFQPYTGKIAEAPEMPTVKSETETDVVVNSVGTIIEVKPKQTKSSKEETAVVEDSKKEIEQQTEIDSAAENTAAVENKQKENSEVKEVTEYKEIIKTDDKKSTTAKVSKTRTRKSAATSPPRRRTRNSAQNIKNADVVAQEKDTKPEETISDNSTSIADLKTAEKNPKPSLSEALEKINLIILFKDGSKIERPMSEISRVSVDRGMLTIVAKNGSIGRYSILEVSKFSIE